MKGFVELLTICAILPICLAGQIDLERHSLYYVYTALSKAVNAPGIFEFTAMGLLDDKKIDYYDSKHQVKIPQQNWMKEKLPADYWEKGTQSRKSKEQWFKVNVNILMERMRQNQSDIHVLMWKHGCEVERMADGSVKFVRGVDAYSYDGNDFLSFDDASMQWVAPVTEAVPTKQKWDGVPILNQYTKGYLEKECVDWLEKFRGYGDQELKQQTTASPPKVHLYARTDSSSDSLKLTCMATGFYPKDIYIAILKGKKVIKEGFPLDVMPNGDNTYQIKLSVEAKKADMNDYECMVNHRGLEAEIKKFWNLDGICPDCSTTFMSGPILGVVVLLIIVALLGVLLFFARKKGIIEFKDGCLKCNGIQPTVIPVEPNPESDSGQESPPGSSASSAEDVNRNGRQPSPQSSENVALLVTQEPKPAETNESDSGQGSGSGSTTSSAEDVNQNGKGSPSGSSTSSAEDVNQNGGAQS